MLIVLCVVGVAEAAPRRDGGGSVPLAPIPMANAAPPVAVQMAPQPQVKSIDVRFAEAITLSSSSKPEDLEAAAKGLAEIAATGDERFARLATARFGDVVQTLLKTDATRAADVAVAAWQSSTATLAFTDALRVVYAQLVKQGVGAVVLGGEKSFGSCAEPAERFQRLVVISSHLNKVEDNARWRDEQANHLRTCNPSPDHMEQAKRLYAELGDAEKARAVALELGNMLIARFSGATADAWRVEDFSAATKALADGGMPKPEIQKKVAEFGKLAEIAKQYRTAAEVYTFLGQSESAETMHVMEEMQTNK